MCALSTEKQSDKAVKPEEKLIESSEAYLKESIWPTQAAIYYQTFERVLDAFRDYQVNESHFLSVTGYGHNDLGREITDKVFAKALQAEAALVRPQFVSGTHAIAVALSGALGWARQNQSLNNISKKKESPMLLSVTGPPYDTLEEVIGIRGKSSQSLISQGFRYQCCTVFSLPESTTPSANPGVDPVIEHYTPDVFFQDADTGTKIADASVIFIQRSRGYSLRPALTIAQLAHLIKKLKTINPNAIVMVDNCYGEFTDVAEPTAVGADLIAGSLIKNPGGGIVPTGGYIAGKHHLIEACAERLTCPGIGTEGGYTFDLSRLILQGLYLAPSMVNTALKGMTLAARLFEGQGVQTMPACEETRSDIIQVIVLKDPEKLIQFCQTLQANSPVNSHLSPVPDHPPGYADAVVMAGGTFIDGSTLELSADGPLRPPYAVFLQGGLSYAHTRLALSRTLNHAFDLEPLRL
ncbi:MAG: methionine gamma-lyase family protein [Cyanobacteria bacterium P01_H01_bin.74]